MKNILYIGLVLLCFSCDKTEVVECYSECFKEHYDTKAFDYEQLSEEKWELLGTTPYSTLCTKSEIDSVNLANPMYPHVNNVGDTLWWYNKVIICF